MTPPRPVTQADVEKSIDADIFYQEHERNAEPEQLPLLKCMVCEAGELVGRFCNECGAEIDI